MELVSKKEEEKASNPLKPGTRKSQEPAHHFFCITSYKATPNLKGRGNSPYLFKGWGGHVHMGKDKNDGSHLRDHSFSIGS